MYDRSEFTIAGRAGVPMEVMGLMLGQFIDEYTINCVDVWFSDFFFVEENVQIQSKVFAMPQSGTGVSV